MSPGEGADAAESRPHQLGRTGPPIQTLADRGDWVMGLLWFGIEVMYSHMVGCGLFMSMVEDPEWVHDRVNTMLASSIALLEMVEAAGCKFDGNFWYNDKGYKGHQFMSVPMVR